MFADLLRAADNFVQHAAPFEALLIFKHLGCTLQYSSLYLETPTVLISTNIIFQEKMPTSWERSGIGRERIIGREIKRHPFFLDNNNNKQRRPLDSFPPNGHLFKVE